MNLSGNDVQYILKKTDYTYSNAGKLLKLVERMYDGSNKEVLRKTVNYYYDGNGNELSNTASWTHPHNIKLRQATKGSVYGDNMENGTDPLIDRVNNTFDGFGRLTKVERISAGVRSVSAYLYNGDNLRVSKTVQKSSNGYKKEVTNYLYDRQNVILETDANNKVKTRYVKGINYIASVNAENKTYYFLFNGHGDVVQTVDKTGEIQNHYDYDIWGNPTLTVELVECAIRYAGEFYDSETGLYYLKSRYYNSAIARFISEDSYTGEIEDPLSLNLYTYCENDPISYTDPNGHWIVDALFLAADLVDFVKSPSLAKAAWIAVDIVSFADPTGAASTAAHATKAVKYTTKTVKIVEGTVKVTKAADKVKDTVKVLDKVKDTVKVADKVKDTVKTADKVKDTVKTADKVKDTVKASSTAKKTKPQVK